jgi:hypothetical protein
VDRAADNGARAGEPAVDGGAAAVRAAETSAVILDLASKPGDEEGPRGTPPPHGTALGSEVEASRAPDHRERNADE